MEILWLGHPECHDPSRVGGKAASLSRLASEHRVPPGFALTTTAFERALGGAPLSQASFESGRSLPRSLYDQLCDAYHGLARICQQTELKVAVRSSAVDEDGATASFAGQHDTFLNVTGEEGVADAVARCWASVNNPHALDYRRRQGLPVEDAKIGVLVQQLVPADASGVVFGANPVTGDRNEVVINASWGLGESIVGGTVTPDTFVVAKESQTVTSRQISEKLRMTVQAPEGTEEVDVPRSLRSKPAVDDDQAVEMARLAIDLERATGWPVDIECAYQGGELYLLQCRPITTLGGAASS